MVVRPHQGRHFEGECGAEQNAPLEERIRRVGLVCVEAMVSHRDRHSADDVGDEEKYQSAPGKDVDKSRKQRHQEQVIGDHEEKHVPVLYFHSSQILKGRI